MNTPLTTKSPPLHCAAMPPPRALLWTLLSYALVAAAPAAAESALQLSPPPVWGDVPARTFDSDGVEAGQASIRTERLPDGRVRLATEAEIHSGERTRLSAELRPRSSGSLQLLRQQSETFDAAGRSLGVLRIDHEARLAECRSGPGGDASSTSLELPERDRVVNVPMNLLFQPLARGDTEQVEFQFLLCSGGARLADARATVSGRHRTASQGRFVEVRTTLDFGPLLSAMVAPFMPRLSMWIGRDGNGWLGHTQPLFARGPTVWVVRGDATPAALDGRIAPPVSSGR